jgi:hypothetical protein
MTDGNDVMVQYFEVYENLQTESGIFEPHGTEYGCLCLVLQKAD